MAKTIIKELIIVLLLCLAIILILGVLLYDYVPTNKIVPEKVSYSVPENIKQELEETVSSEDLEVILTYEVDSADLKNYEKVNKLDTGKPNPFSSYVKEDVQNNQTSNNEVSSNGQNTTNTGSTTNENESPYMQNTGTK